MLSPDELRAAFERIDAAMPRYGTDAMAKGPWLYSVDGHDWAVVTNGHYLVGVPRDRVAGDLGAVPSKALGLVSKWLPFAPASRNPLSVMALREFARANEPDADCHTCNNKREISCRECDGEGQSDCECSACGNEHEAQCGECDGHGMITCPECRGGERPGKLLAHVINTVYLADILRMVAVGDDSDIHVSVESGVSTAAKYDGYFLRGTEWVALLTPMAGHVKPQCSFKEPVTVPAVPNHGA